METQSIEKLRQMIVEAITKAVIEKGNVKPEHMTSLRGDELVYKDHPRIAFRGAMDSLEAEIILLQVAVAKERLRKLYLDLSDVINEIRMLIRCEVSESPIEDVVLQGLSLTDMREHSHHPSKYYGIKHFLPTADHGGVVAGLNRLRTLAREAELVAYKAFKKENGEVFREDIIKVLNRLSSLFWIMMCKYLSGAYVDEGLVEVEASGRHVHLSKKDVEELFGKGYRLIKDRDLSQPGQYACKERVDLVGPKGIIKNVVVLGPERKETQVEVSFTDGLALGIKPPVRQSGDVKDSPGITISHGDKQITISQGVIVAKRHMHVSEEDAKRLQIEDGQLLDIEVQGSRPVIFKDTVARVNKDYATYVHIDYDEANACGYQKGMYCKIVR